MDWHALGQALQRAREAAGWTQREAASRLNVGYSTVQGIERGIPRARVSATMRSYAAALGWPRGAVENVLAGGEPPQPGTVESISVRESVGEVKRAPAAPVPAIEGQLPLRIVSDLNAPGAVLDTAVVVLPGGVQAVVVLKGQVDSSPEELQAAMDAWKRTSPRLQEWLREEPPAAAGA
ncbi:helix-turn-helix domain-containing protein [Streptomyces sp. NPDC001493]